MSRDGREHDLQELRQMYGQTQDPRRRREISEAAAKIQSQRGNGSISSMREALIKANREGRADEIKDIHSFIKGKGKYQ